MIPLFNPGTSVTTAIHRQLQSLKNTTWLWQKVILKSERFLQRHHCADLLYDFLVYCTHQDMRVQQNNGVLFPFSAILHIHTMMDPPHPAHRPQDSVCVQRGILWHSTTLNVQLNKFSQVRSIIIHFRWKTFDLKQCFLLLFKDVYRWKRICWTCNFRGGSWVLCSNHCKGNDFLYNCSESRQCNGQCSSSIYMFGNKFFLYLPIWNWMKIKLQNLGWNNLLVFNCRLSVCLGIRFR